MQLILRHVQPHLGYSACSLNSFLLVAKAGGKNQNPCLCWVGKQELERADSRHTGLSLHQERAATLQKASPSPRLLPKPSTESLLGGSPENTPGTGQRCRCAHRIPLLSPVPSLSPTLQRAGLAPAARGLQLGLNLPKTASFRCVDAVKAAAAAAAAFSVSRVSSFMSPLVRKREKCKIKQRGTATSILMFRGDAAPEVIPAMSSLLCSPTKLGAGFERLGCFPLQGQEAATSPGAAAARLSSVIPAPRH